jgi:hypothetical protein
MSAAGMAVMQAVCEARITAVAGAGGQAAWGSGLVIDGRLAAR